MGVILAHRNVRSVTAAAAAVKVKKAAIIKDTTKGTKTKSIEKTVNAHLSSLSKEQLTALLKKIGSH